MGRVLAVVPNGLLLQLNFRFITTQELADSTCGFQAFRKADINIAKILCVFGLTIQGLEGV
jgi:hypothetical protein